jgi:hypothetical protein
MRAVFYALAWQKRLHAPPGDLAKPEGESFRTMLTNSWGKWWVEKPHKQKTLVNL